MATIIRAKILAIAFITLVAQTATAADYYVSPSGNDASPGTESEPFATLDRARLAVRARITAGLNADLQVLIREGTYRIESPIVFGLQDSPPANRNITYAAYPNEHPVISGGRQIEGWSPNGDGSWTTTIPAVVSEPWHFRELFVNGKRRTRARHPNTGFANVAGPDAAGGPNNRTSFVFAPGALPTTTNLAGAELVFMHEWGISRVRIAGVNHATRVLTVSEPIGAVGLINSVFQTEDHPRYFVENDAALLDVPGEWHLNTTTGLLTYRPMPGEFMQTAEVVAPKATELIAVRGNFTTGAPVRNLHFQGLAFEHCAWALPAGGYAEYQAGYYEWRDTSTPYTLPTAVTFEVADGCTFESGRIAHCGGWGMMFGAWCKNCRLTGNIVEDIAGNGVLIGEDRYRNVTGDQWWSVRPDQVAIDNTIDSNLVQDCGRTLYGCVGIWAGLTDTTAITNNLVRRIPWTGISVGGLWNDTPSPCRETQITGNKIHNVMQLLSDGAGIYTVGLQPASNVIGNRIHDIPVNVGLSDSNAMFFDQGTTGFSITDNGIFNVIKAPFRFHASGVNSVTSNVMKLSSNTVPAIRFQNMNSALVTFTGNTIYTPATPPPCSDPVCNEAINAGIAAPHSAIIFVDRDNDGIPNVDDPCPNRAPGDVNGDGSIDAADIAPIIDVLLGESLSSDDYCAADTNGNGAVQHADIAAFTAILLAN